MLMTFSHTIMLLLGPKIYFFNLKYTSSLKFLNSTPVRKPLFYSLLHFFWWPCISMCQLVSGSVLARRRGRRSWWTRRWGDTSRPGTTRPRTSRIPSSSSWRWSGCSALSISSCSSQSGRIHQKMCRRVIAALPIIPCFKFNQTKDPFCI